MCDDNESTDIKHDPWEWRQLGPWLPDITAGKYFHATYVYWEDVEMYVRNYWKLLLGWTAVTVTTLDIRNSNCRPNMTR